MERVYNPKGPPNPNSYSGGPGLGFKGSGSGYQAAFQLSNSAAAHHVTRLHSWTTSSSLQYNSRPGCFPLMLQADRGCLL